MLILDVNTTLLIPTKPYYLLRSIIFELFHLKFAQE